MDTNSTKALIEQFHHARANRDTEKLASLMSEDVVLIPPIGFREVGTIVRRAGRGRAEPWFVDGPDFDGRGAG